MRTLAASAKIARERSAGSANTIDLLQTFAVSEDRAYARLRERLDGSIRLLRRVVDMRPVENASHAAIDGAEGAE